MSENLITPALNTNPQSSMHHGQALTLYWKEEVGLPWTIQTNTTEVFHIFQGSTTNDLLEKPFKLYIDINNVLV